MSNDDFIPKAYNNMDLRDYFAARALQIIPSDYYDGRLAARAYILANEMMFARSLTIHDLHEQAKSLPP